jgi:hypothetical protein
MHATAPPSGTGNVACSGPSSVGRWVGDGPLTADGGGRDDPRRSPGTASRFTPTPTGSAAGGRGVARRHPAADRSLMPQTPGAVPADRDADAVLDRDLADYAAWVQALGGGRHGVGRGLSQRLGPPRIRLVRPPPVSCAAHAQQADHRRTAVVSALRQRRGPSLLVRHPRDGVPVSAGSCQLSRLAAATASLRVDGSVHPRGHAGCVSGVGARHRRWLGRQRSHTCGATVIDDIQ